MGFVLIKHINYVFINQQNFLSQLVGVTVTHCFVGAKIVVQFQLFLIIIYLFNNNNNNNNKIKKFSPLVEGNTFGFHPIDAGSTPMLLLL